LCLVLLAVFVCVALAGWTHGVGAEGTGPATQTGPAGPQSIMDGGPVVRIGADGQPVTRSMAANTVALTFDDGPDPQWTPAVLEVLRRHHAHATFFVIGSKVNEHPELARQILADGNEIGVHTFTHPDLSAVPSWRLRLELTLTQNSIAAATGRQT